MDHTHTSDPQNSLDTAVVPVESHALAAVGQVANEHAARGVFAEDMAMIRTVAGYAPKEARRIESGVSLPGGAARKRRRSTTPPGRRTS